MKRSLAALVLVELAAFGPFAGRAGFYHDDWFFLELASRSHGFWEVVREFGRIIDWSRPVEMLTFPLFFAIGGWNPVVYAGLLILLETLQGWLFFLLLDGLLGSRTTALAAAILFLTYPNHAVTHVWFANSPQSIALTAALASLVAHQRWLESRRSVWLTATLFAYAAGALCYESVVFLPLLSGGARAVRKSLDGLRPSAAGLAASREFWPYAPTLLAVAIWQRAIAPAFSRKIPAKAAGLSLAHAAGVFKAGFGCITYQTVRLCLRTDISALHDLPRGLLLAAPLLSLAAAAALSFGRDDGAADRRRAALIAAGAAVGGFLAANLPYALAIDYWPTYVGLMSRTSALGALPGGLLLAAGFAILPRPRLRVAVFATAALIFSAFTLCDWHASRQWSLSWRLQQDILRMAARKTEGLPPRAAVLLTGAPRYINTEINEVVVFDASWDIGPALRLAAGRPDLSANVVSPRMRFDDRGYFEQAPGESAHPSPSPYANVYLYRYDRDLLASLSGPPSPPLQLRDF